MSAQAQAQAQAAQAQAAQAQAAQAQAAQAQAAQAQAAQAQAAQAVAGFTPAVLNSMVDRVSSFTNTINNNSPSFFDQLSCQKGSACYNKKRSEYLRKNMSDAEVNLAEAPFDLSLAEKNYYVFNNGQNGGQAVYNNLIIDRFATTAAQFRENSKEKELEFMANLMRNISQYQGDALLLKRETDLLKIREREKEDLLKKLNKYETILQTSERKAVYENKNMDSLSIYRQVMLFIYYSIIVGYVVFGNFIPDQMYKKSNVWLILIIAVIFPIILNLIMKWLFILVDAVSYWYADIPHKDVYKELNK
jgi:hypothetical protein